MSARLTRRLSAEVAAAHGDARALLVRLGHPRLADAQPKAVSLPMLLDAAEHEASLARHPYIDGEHVVVAAHRLAGLDEEVPRLRKLLADRPLPRRRFWRPLGPRSAMRPAGQASLDRRYEAAKRREEQPG